MGEKGITHEYHTFEELEVSWQITPGYTTSRGAGSWVFVAIPDPSERNGVHGKILIHLNRGQVARGHCWIIALCRHRDVGYTAARHHRGIFALQAIHN